MSMLHMYLKDLFPFLACLTLVAISPLHGQNPSDTFPAGTWIGTVSMGEVNPRLIFEISLDSDNRYSGHVGSPDSGASGIPISNLEVYADSLFIEVSVANASFVGVYDSESSSVIGVWRDGSNEFELVLSVYDDSDGNLEAEHALPVRLESTHFSFNFANEDTNDYSSLIDYLEQNYDELKKTLKVELDGKIEVSVYPSITLFHQAIFAPGSPNWVVGAAGVRHLKFVSPFNPGSVHSYSSIFETAVHELIHTLVLHIHGGDVSDIPKWLNEGFAYYHAGQFTVTQSNWIAETLSLAELPSWDELADYGSVDFAEHHGYELSGSIVDFLTSVYGSDKVTLLIKMPSDIDSIFGKSQKNLEIEWRLFVTNQQD